MKNSLAILCVVLSMVFLGCQTVHKAGEATGSVVGEAANTVGSVTEGGAGAVQGKVTSEENPYGR